MEGLNRGRYGRPPRAKYFGTHPPFGYSGNKTPHWPKVSRAIGGEALLHAHFGARSGGAPVPHPTLSRPEGGGGEPGLAVANLSLVNHGFTGSCGANVSLYHTPGWDRTSRAHPSGVLRRFGPRGWWCVA